MQSGAAQWVIPEVAPRESRRIRMTAPEPAEVFVQVANWAPEPPVRLFCDWRETTTTTLRLDASRAVMSTSEVGLLSRLLNW